jgi:RNA polymerase sigma-70 factor (ECF subfamily)
VTFFRGRADRLSAFRAGQRQAVEEVYWAYVDRVERIVRYGFAGIRGNQRISGVPASEVADVVQEVFVRAFRESARLAYDGLRDYAPFLDTIARNVVVDWARRRGHALEELPENIADASSEGERNLESDVAGEALIRFVERYIAELPQELRQVHEQRYVLGRSQNETAERLSVSRQKVRTLEDRLREGLRRALRRAKLADK